MQVVKQWAGSYSVKTELGQIVLENATHEEAWRFVDKHTGEPVNKSQDTSDWSFNKRASE